MSDGTIDKHQFKITIATAISVLLFIIFAASQFSAWRVSDQAAHQEFDDRITHLGDKVVGMREDIKNLNDRASTRDIELATINTKLANIETLLLQIQQDIREKDGK